MDLYLFNQDEQLTHILNNEDLLTVIHTEKTTGENTLDVVMLDKIVKAEGIKEGNFLAFYDLDNDFIMFEILRIEDEETSGGITKKIFCENVYYELRDNVIEDLTVLQATAISALSAALAGSRWSVGDVDVFGIYQQNFYYQSSLQAIEDIRTRWQFSDANGAKSSGVFKYRLTLTGNVITGRTVDYKQQIGAYRGKRAVIGKDITSIKRIVDNTELITACYGRGKGEEVQSDNNTLGVNISQVGNKSVEKRVSFSTSIWANDFPTFLNSSFNVDLSQWNINSGTIVQTSERYFRGTGSAKITDTVGSSLLVSDLFTVTAGQRIGLNVWVNTPTTILVGQQKQSRVYLFYYIGGVYNTESSIVYSPINPNQWEIIEYDDIVPAGIDGIKFGLGTNTDDAEAGNIYFDEFNPTQPVNKPAGQEFVQDDTALLLYGRAGGTINRMGFFYDDEEQKSNNLLQKTWDFLQQNNSPKITYEANILDLESLLGYEHEKMRLGDLILLLDENFRIPVDISSNIIEMERDLLLPENTKVTLGNYLRYVADINQKQQDLERKISARQDVWDRSSAFETSIEGTRMRMVSKDGEFLSVIKYEDDSIPPNLIGYFSPEEFSYSRIRSDSFIGQNIINVVQDPIDYYIDSYAGDDTNTGLVGFPYKTISRLLAKDTIPKIMLEEINVYITDTSPGGPGTTPYEEDVRFEGLLGSGLLYLNFGADVVLNGSIRFISCSNRIEIKGEFSAPNILYGFITTTNGNTPIRCDNCTQVVVRYMWCDANELSLRAGAAFGSNIEFVDSNFDGATVYGLDASNNSQVEVVRCTGNNPSANFGCIARTASLMGCFGSVPTAINGTTSGHDTGGILSPSSQTGETAIVGVAAPGTVIPPPPPPVQVTATSTISTSSSWRYNYNLWRTDNDDIYQGSWGYGNHLGLMLFSTGTTFSTVAAAATTIKSAVLYIKRLNNGGYATAGSVRVYGHDRTTRPTPWNNSYLKRNYGNLFTIKWGETVAVTMPAQFLLDVNSGLVKGLAIYQSTQTPYIRLSGDSKYATRVVFKYE